MTAGPGARAPSEGRRALVATALGLGLGALIALFSRDDRLGRNSRWRGRSAT
jgi:hypothetical protein